MIVMKNFFQREPTLQKPIFIVGCARSGTTALSAPIYFHPKVGPKPLAVQGITLQDFINDLLDYNKHLEFSECLERKELWFDFFNQARPLADMGKELIIEKLTSLMGKKKKQLLNALMTGFAESRFLSKSPTHSFRILALKEIFKDAIFIAIHRNGCDVVSSWGLRHYGFSKMGFREGIDVFATKWNETVDYLFSQTEKVQMHHVRYEDLVMNPAATLSSIYDFCGLDKNEVSYQSLQFQTRAYQWQEKIPKQFHELLLEKTYRNRLRLGYEPAK